MLLGTDAIQRGRREQRILSEARFLSGGVWGVEVSSGAPAAKGLWPEQAQRGEWVHRKVRAELLGGGPEKAAETPGPSATAWLSLGVGGRLGVSAQSAEAHREIGSARPQAGEEGTRSRRPSRCKGRSGKGLIGFQTQCVRNHTGRRLQGATAGLSSMASALWRQKAGPAWRPVLVPAPAQKGTGGD